MEGGVWASQWRWKSSSDKRDVVRQALEAGVRDFSFGGRAGNEVTTVTTIDATPDAGLRRHIGKEADEKSLLLVRG